MTEITIVGIDLAKNVFQLHGVDAGGSICLRRRLRRSRMLAFFGDLPPCLVGMEACAGAHYWARELTALGHQVRLMPASYVKPYVKRGKTDAADAEAICEAVTRPTMRFVPVKSEESQALLLLHRARDFLVRQVTQTGNAIRAHCAEFGLVAPKGPHHLERLLGEAEGGALSEAALAPIRLLATQLRAAREKVAALTRKIEAAHRSNATSRRLATIPGVGALTASAIVAATPDVSNFRSARDYAAWLGLTPKPHSSGGKDRVGRVSKMGNRHIRRLLFLGAMSRIRARRRGDPGEDWLWKMLDRKPVRLVAAALTNRMARTIFALLRSGETYRAPVMA